MITNGCGLLLHTNRRGTPSECPAIIAGVGDIVYVGSEQFVVHAVLKYGNRYRLLCTHPDNLGCCSIDAVVGKVKSAYLPALSNKYVSRVTDADGQCISEKLVYTVTLHMGFGLDPAEYRVNDTTRTVVVASFRDNLHPDAKVAAYAEAERLNAAYERTKNGS